MDQGEGRQAGTAEWLNDVEGLVAVYDTLVSVPDHTSMVYATKELQVTPSLLKIGWQVCTAGYKSTSKLLAASNSQAGRGEQTELDCNSLACAGSSLVLEKLLLQGSMCIAEWSCC